MMQWTGWAIRQIRTAVVLAAPLALSAGSPASASSVPFGNLESLGCITQSGGSEDCGLSTSGLRFAQSVVISPDGRNVYVASGDSGAIVTFNRDGGGRLTPRGCIGDPGSNESCSATSAGLAGVRALAVSPGGGHVYAASARALVVLGRDASTGRLNPAGCIEEVGADQGCTSSAAGLAEATSVAIAPDGRNVYVTASDSGTVALFERQAGTGLLRSAGCIKNSSSNEACSKSTYGIAGATSIALSPDGDSAYVTGGASGSLAIFARSTSTGALKPRGCIKDRGFSGSCAQDAVHLSAPNDVDVSRDGRSVYVASGEANAIMIFDRDQDSGRLKPSGCVGSGGDGACRRTSAGLQLPAAVAVSRDGDTAYVASSISMAVATFIRHRATGELVPAGCIMETGSTNDSCTDTAAGLLGATSVVVSGDGRSVYVASRTSNAVAAFRRNVPPPLPRVKIGRRSVRLSGNGIARVRIACLAGGEEDRCRGTLSVRTRSSTTAANRSRRIRIGKRSFSIRDGKAARVAVRITQVGRDLIEARRRLRVVLTARTRDPARGIKTTTRRTIKLRAR